MPCSTRIRREEWSLRRELAVRWSHHAPDRPGARPLVTAGLVKDFGRSGADTAILRNPFE